ncbi:hypothetical protein ALC56_09916, partial [Trachymyrmex septentrionalis]
RIYIILDKTLDENLEKPYNYIKNSFQLMNDLPKVNLSNDSMLVSLDVVSLFTNILVRLVIKSIERRCHFLHNKIDLLKEEFFKAISLVLNFIYFSFNDKFYKKNSLCADKNNTLYNWYHKPTFSAKYLNFFNFLPFDTKKGTIFSLVDRAFLLSDNIFHTKNLTFIINILLLNDYPLDFIFDTMNQRIKNLIKKIHNVHNVTTDNDVTKESTSWLTVPFIPSHTEKFRTLRKNKGDIRIAFHSPNKMNKYIRVQKDTCPRTSKNNVVYKILCNDCDASYVGQTGRKLKTRIAEHRNHIRYKTSTRSVITEHRLLHNHDFQWDDVQILDEEPSYRKRLISEMLHIKKQKNSQNLQTDTESLHKAYIPIINKV